METTDALPRCRAYRRCAVEATYLVECFWPGLTRKAVAAADARVRARVTELREEGSSLRYLGSLLVPGDEVVFFQFQAISPEQVSRASAEAGLPFERVIESVYVDSARARKSRGGSGRRTSHPDDATREEDQQ